MPVEYRVLGPLEAHVGGRRVELGTPKQRALLARLLLQPNTVVPAARLVDELWGTPEGVKTPTSKLVVYQQPTSPATPA